MSTKPFNLIPFNGPTRSVNKRLVAPMSSDEPPEILDRGVASIGQEQSQSLPQGDVSPVRNLLYSLRNLMSQPFGAGGGQATTDTPPDAPPQPRRRTRREIPEAPIPLSAFSSPAVPNSAWCASNFMVGAGMVILQPSTGKVVVLYDEKNKFWFLPRGRKDVGESLEATALREAYEEVLPYQYLYFAC